MARVSRSCRSPTSPSSRRPRLAIRWSCLGKQVFATRYMTGGLSLTAITTDTATGANYLVYLNRTGVDLLGGLFGSLKRSVLESRLKSEVPNIIQNLRVRLERH